MCSRRHAVKAFACIFSLAIALPAASQNERWLELNRRALELYDQGNYADAIPIAQEVVRLAESNFGPVHANVAASLTNLAMLYRAQWSLSKSEPILRRALDIWEKLVNPEDPRLIQPLANLANVYHSEAKYGLEEPLLKRTLLIQEKAYGPVNSHVAESLNNLGLMFRAESRFADAEQFYQGALAVEEAVQGKEHVDVAAISINLAELYVAMGRYTEAESLCQRALAIHEKTPGSRDANEAAARDILASVYQEEGKYAKAEPLFQNAIAIREEAVGKERPEVATLLNHLAGLYKDQGAYGKAEPLYKRSLTIDENALGKTHLNVARDLGDLAALEFAEGRYSDAEPLFKRALTMYQALLGDEHPNVATSMNNLASLDYARGNYAEAESLSQRALDIDEKVLGANHPLVATSLGNLALLYRSEGRDGDAELMLRRALTIYENALGKTHPRVATALANLAALYEAQGKYGQAEAMYQQAVAIRGGTADSEHPDVAIYLNDLGSVSRVQAKRVEAEKLFQRALDIYERSLGKDHPFVAITLNNLALVYRDEGRPAQAEPLQRRALAILEANVGQDHPDVALSLNNLAGICEAEGKRVEAERLFRRALAMDEKTFGSKSPRLANYLNNLAGLYYSDGRYAQAGPLFDRARQLLEDEFDYQFTYMSEKDRLSFLDKVAGNAPLFFSFALTYSKKDPTLTGKMYDSALWEKGLVARSVTAARAKIGASGDKEALSLFEVLTGLRTQLANLRDRPGNDVDHWRETVQRLEQESNDVEANVARRIGTLGGPTHLDRATWQDVRKALRPGEAAVEFVRFPYNDGKKWTDKSYYIALIVTAATEAAPILVQLGEAGVLEGEPMADYRDRVAERPTEGAGARFYQAVWKPLKAYLAGHSRIYISPDGVLNEVAFGVVPADDGHLLMDDYDIDIELSTRDLLRESRHPGGNSAVLIGNPEFGLDASQQKAELEKLSAGGASQVELAAGLRPASIARGSGSTKCPDLPPGGVLCPLKDTQIEVDDIFSRLEHANWQVPPPYVRARALKEVVKRVEHPRLLHVATHGFFFPDQERKLSDLTADTPSGLEDPMLRSGLMFAGADRALKGALPANEMDDGVLTAYEASGLDLEGTELVVLSACETGLGKIRDGEGVFGLRRALQEAGAESVLMSMWSVPSKETRELMMAFYVNWLSGIDKHQALHKAQKEMRDKVKARFSGQDRPYYWGAFVLVGSLEASRR